MKLFLEITKRSFQRHLTYRAATVAGLITNFFFGLVRGAIFLALFGARGAVNGLDAQGMLTYAALGQALIGYLNIFWWADLMESVYTGEVSVDLLHPVGLFQVWLAKDFGRAALNFFSRGVVIMVAFEMVWDLSYPATLAQWGWVGLAMGISWLISFAFRFLINLSAFWTPEASGVLRLLYTLSWFFSGFLMPLRLFPEWVQTLSRFTPFPQMINTVMEIYLGLLAGPAVVQALIVQGLWAGGLIAAGQIVMRAGLRRLVILGG